MESIHRATVAGTGMMGPGIASTLALGGVTTTILGRSEGSAWNALQMAREQLLLLEQNEIITTRQANGAIERMDASHDFRGALRGRDLVVESIPEDMELKQAWIAEVEAIVSPECWITSNTSGLSITVMSEKSRFPERIATTHFWNPAHLMPLVEIVRSEKTASHVVLGLRALYERCGKVPVVVKKDRPGQLGNRLQMAMVREAVNIISEGIADVEDVDRAASLGFGLRLPVYGIFEHQDLVGRDAFTVCDYVAKDLYNQPGAPPLYRLMHEMGKLGAKPGMGFHDWSNKDADQVRNRRDRWLREFLRSSYGDWIRPKPQD
jgi:3-hydroxybutyryl-CoA dehydrogenase